MMTDARNLATNRMTEEAEQLGADAIVNIRYARYLVYDHVKGSLVPQRGHNPQIENAAVMVPCDYLS